MAVSKPADTGHVVCRLVDVGTLEADDDPWSGIASVLWYAGDYVLSLPIGESDPLPVFRRAVNDQAYRLDQVSAYRFLLITHAGSNAPLNSGSA